LTPTAPSSRGRDREQRAEAEPAPGPAEDEDDTLQLFFLCAHPSLSPTAAVALTLRAVGGLTTRQIAQAYLVPEATMAQRISRAKRTVRDVRFSELGDLATVLRVLYLVFNEGYTGDVDLAAEAIRLTRQLASRTQDEETAGLLALMLLHHARRSARTRRDGSLIPLTEQDRARWDTSLIAEGVEILQTALARDRLGEFQAQAAIAALHADCTARRGDRLGADRQLVRRAAPAHREPDRGAQPGHRDRRGRWRESRPRGLGLGGTRSAPATPPPRPTSTRRRVTCRPRHGCMPTPPGPPPTSPNATTSPGRQRGSVRRCASDRRGFRFAGTGPVPDALNRDQDRT